MSLTQSGIRCGPSRCPGSCDNDHICAYALCSLQKRRNNVTKVAIEPLFNGSVVIDTFAGLLGGDSLETVHERIQ